jgi:hypothetical protein
MATTIHCDPSLPFLYNQPTFPISTLKTEEIHSSKTFLSSHSIHITSHKTVAFMFHKTSQPTSSPLSWLPQSLAMPPLSNYIPDRFFFIPTQNIPNLHNFFYLWSANPWSVSLNLPACCTHSPAHSRPPLLSFV